MTPEPIRPASYALLSPTRRALYDSEGRLARALDRLDAERAEVRRSSLVLRAAMAPDDAELVALATTRHLERSARRYNRLARARGQRFFARTACPCGAGGLYACNEVPGEYRCQEHALPCDVRMSSWREVIG